MIAATLDSTGKFHAELRKGLTVEAKHSKAAAAVIPEGCSAAVSSAAASWASHRPRLT